MKGAQVRPSSWLDAACPPYRDTPSPGCQPRTVLGRVKPSRRGAPRGVTRSGIMAEQGQAEDRTRPWGESDAQIGDACPNAAYNQTNRMADGGIETVAFRPKGRTLRADWSNQGLRERRETRA